MEINAVDQTNEAFIQTNIKFMNTPGHIDISNELVKTQLMHWVEEIENMDFKNINIFRIELVFLGRMRKEEDDK